MWLTFNNLLCRYEKMGKFHKQVKAQKLWFAILEAQTETGTPYMLYKDACNRKSNQQNLGTIKCSNLCTEIVEYSSPDEVNRYYFASTWCIVWYLGCCLQSCINCFKSLCSTWGKVWLQKTWSSDKCHNKKPQQDYWCKLLPRPWSWAIQQKTQTNWDWRAGTTCISIHLILILSYQGLADAFILMRYPFDSPEAEELNKKVFETIYYFALKVTTVLNTCNVVYWLLLLQTSCEIAKEQGPYETYQGSPVSKGILQQDMWDVQPSNLWDWDELKADIAKYACAIIQKLNTFSIVLYRHGIRNSLLVSPMPTASTAQILGNNESIEPYTSNIYSRRVLSGEFQVVNHHLLKDLTELGMWDDTMKQKIIAHNGSVQVC